MSHNGTDELQIFFLNKKNLLDFYVHEYCMLKNKFYLRMYSIEILQIYTDLYYNLHY